MVVRCGALRTGDTVIEFGDEIVTREVAPRCACTNRRASRCPATVPEYHFDRIGIVRVKVDCGISWWPTNDLCPVAEIDNIGPGKACFRKISNPVVPGGQCRCDTIRCAERCFGRICGYAEWQNRKVEINQRNPYAGNVVCAGDAGTAMQVDGTVNRTVGITARRISLSTDNVLVDSPRIAKIALALRELAGLRN